LIGVSKGLVRELRPPAAPLLPSGGAGRRSGDEDGPIPTERRTAGENVATATVCEPLSPRAPGPEPSAWKTTLRARRSLALAFVASERIGSPIVTQRTATSGSASKTGRARERERVMLRAEGSRLGRST
jgi:hypothetical protein